MFKLKLLKNLAPMHLFIANANAEEGAQVIVRWDPKNPPKAGDTISVTADPSAVHVFDAQSGKRL